MGTALTYIKKYYPFILFIVVFLLALSLFQTCSTLKKERAYRAYQEEQDNQNMSSLKDSIIVEFNKKLHAWEYSKDNYVVQRLSDLETYNKLLANELKKIKGDVIAAIKTDAKTDLGGIIASNSLMVLDSNFYGLKFDSRYKDAGFEQHLVGSSKFYIFSNEKTKKWTIIPDSTNFDINTSSIKITYGFKEENNKYKVFAISQSPKITFDDLTGGYIINNQPAAAPINKKKWGIGPYIGFGLDTNPNGSAPRFGWSLGIGVTYDIIQW